MEFSYLDYSTTYSYDLKNKKGLRFRSESMLISNACFARLFSDVNYRNNLSGKLVIFINRDINYLVKEKLDNLCLLNNNELNEYLRFIKSLDSNVKISKSKTIKKHKSEDGFCITLRFDNSSSWTIKTMATLIRNIYESTYSIQLKTAFKMKNHKEFKGMDLNERLCVAMNAINVKGYGHAVYCRYAKSYTKAQLVERYDKNKDKLINVSCFYEEVSGPEFDKIYLQDFDPNVELSVGLIKKLLKFKNAMENEV